MSVGFETTGRARLLAPRLEDEPDRPRKLTTLALVTRRPDEVLLRDGHRAVHRFLLRERLAKGETPRAPARPFRPPRRT